MKKIEEAYLPARYFQEIMLVVRQLLGWSAQEFGDLVGLRRQTINNLEKNVPGYYVSKLQYIAMRSVINDETTDSNGKKKEGYEIPLALLDAYVDHRENYDDEARKEIFNRARLVAPSIKEDPDNKKVATALFFAGLGSALLGQFVGAGILLYQAKKVKEKDKNGD